MRKIERSVTIGVPVERVWDYLTRPENLVDIWPSMVEVRNVQRNPNGSHRFDWTYEMAGLRFEGHSETTEIEENRRLVSHNERGIPSTFEYRFEPRDGETRFTMTVQYEIPNTLLDKLAEPIVAKLNEREAETLLANLKDVLELSEARAAE